MPRLTAGPAPTLRAATAQPLSAREAIRGRRLRRRRRVLLPQRELPLQMVIWCSASAICFSASAICFACSSTIWRRRSFSCRKRSSSRACAFSARAERIDRRCRPGFIERRVPDYVRKYKRDLNCYDTGMLRAGFDGNPEGLAELGRYHPIGRIARPAEIADAIGAVLAPPTERKV